MDKQKFDFRPGCLDFGTDYEYLMAAFYGLKLSINHRCKDFKVSTNNDAMGNFDDVVLEIEFTNDEKHLYALQLKHRADKENNVSIESLIKPKDDHSLEKYCKGFDEIRQNFSDPSIDFKNCHFILFTNAFVPLKYFKSFDRVKKQEVFLNEIPLKKSGIYIIKHDECVGDSLINVTDAKEHFIYKFRTEKDGLLDEDFLQQFFLYTKQETAKNIEAIISLAIHNEFKNKNPSVVVNYLNFFKYWCRGSFKNIKLTKKDVSLKLAEYLLTPKIPEIDLNSVKYFQDKSDLVSEIISEFDILLFEDEKAVEEKILGAVLRNFPKFLKHSGPWSRPLSSDEDFDLLPEDVNIPMSAQGQNFIDQSLKKFYIILWHMGLVPMLIKIDESSKESVLETISVLSVRKKFIIIGGGIVREDLKDWKVCEKVEDLNQRLYTKFVENFTLSPQGRSEISIKNFLVDDDLVKSLSMNDVLRLVDDNLTIGDTKKDALPKHYVTRQIPKVFINPQAMSDIEDDIFVVSCKLQELKKHFDGNCVDLNKYLVLKDSDNSASVKIKQTSILEKDKEIGECFVIYTNKTCSKYEFQAISSMNPAKNCHHVKINDQKRFELVDTRGSVENLKQFRLNYEDDFVEDKDVLDYFRSKINVVCADPGLGKSVLFRYLKQHAPSTHWIIKINLNDYVKFFKETHETAEIFDYSIKIESRDSFDEKILTILAAQRRILFLWDGFDELPEACTKNAVTVMKFLTNDGFSQWVSARNNSREFLEKSFNVLSLTMRQYSNADQRSFVYGSLKDTIKDIDKFIDKINENITNSLTCGYFDYSGNPLQIYMIVEIFKKNPDKYIEEAKLITLPDIYDEFIRSKFDDYFGKANAKAPNAHMKNIQTLVKNTMISHYQIAALRASFDQELLKAHKINTDKPLREVLQKKDNLGIVLGTTEDNKPIFAHKTFEEFLTAWWLTENHRKYPELVKVIFEEDYTNVRLMFDMILARECPVHLSILYRNLEILQHHKDEIAKSKDKAGRNGLHIACSWGKKHDDATDQHKIIEILLENHCPVASKDDLLNLTPLGYCQIVSSLATIEHMLVNDEINKQFLGDLGDFDTPTLLYNSIKFNYTKIFFSFKEIPFLELDDNGTLLQYAVKMDRQDFVAHLLKFNHHRLSINHPYKILGSPLYTACINKNMPIFKMLLENGAKSSRNGVPVLIAAVYSGQREFCEELLKRGDSANITNMDGSSALQVAAMSDEVEIMQLLIDNNADVNYIYNDLSALNFSIDNQSVRGVELLVANGADVNRQNQELIGFNAVHSAAERRSLEIVELLLKNGGDATMKNHRLYTPLHVALINQHEDIALALIQHAPSEINAYNLDTSTPVLLAALANFPKTIQVLAELGADVNSEQCSHSPLHIACLKSYKTCASVLIKFKANTNRLDASGNTPIFYAINDLEILQLLLENGADVNYQTDTGMSPLYFATTNQRVDAVKKLLQYKADVFAKTNSGQSPLSCAIKQNSEEILKMFLSQNLTLSDDLLCNAAIDDASSCLLILLNCGLDVNSRDAFGRTCLHYAAMKSLVCVKILIHKSASVNVEDNENLSPLCFAICLNQTEIIQELLKANADVYRGFGAITSLHLTAALGDITSLILVVSKFDVDCVDNRNQSALHFAVNGIENEDVIKILHALTLRDVKIVFRLNYNHDDCIQELITRGANVDLQDAEGLTPLHLAIAKKSLSTVKILLDSGADVSVKNNSGDSPLVCAVLHNNLESLKLLIIKTQNPDEYQRCFFCAAYKNNVEALEILLKHNLADIDKPDEENSMTALHFACKSNSFESVSFLIKNQANLEMKASGGITALHLAVLNKNLAIVNLLLENNVKVNACNDHGNSALQMAASRSLEIVKILLENGALIDVGDKDGDSALDEAAASGNLEIVQFLTDYT